MERERPLVLKPASIGNHSSLLNAYIHSHHSRGSSRTGFLDVDLDRHVPVARFTGHRCPQNLDGLTHDLLALVPLVRRNRRLPLFNKAELFGQIHRSQLAQELAAILPGLALVEDEAAKTANADPMTATRTFAIVKLKRLFCT